MKKKLFSMLLSIVMILSLMPVAAFASVPSGGEIAGTTEKAAPKNASAESFEFTVQPRSGIASKSGSYSFSCELSDTPDYINLLVWIPSEQSWAGLGYLDGYSGTIKYYDIFIDNNVTKCKLHAQKRYQAAYSDVFTVTWNACNITATGVGNPGSYYLGYPIQVQEPGLAVALSADATFNGLQFDRWVSDDVVINNAEKPNAAYFTMPNKDVIVKATYKTNPVSGFADVSASDYYYDPVMWAVKYGITAGTDATHFEPESSCTRGQIVTFLWRATGCPEPKNSNNPFVDVNVNDYYYKAVMWAVENGITAGMDANHFEPESPCTRAQTVTFLWRAQGKPAPVRTTNPFADVSAGVYYYDPVLWAVENRITSGVDATHFAPEETCTRGQIVTFIYRTYE